MSTDELLAQLDAEIGRLQQARALLNGEPVKRSPGRPTGAAPKKKRKMSPEGRARIVAAVKARWAKTKKKAA
jgi:hypothetical protein